jgi:hypothetical protein
MGLNLRSSRRAWQFSSFGRGGWSSVFRVDDHVKIGNGYISVSCPGNDRIISDRVVPFAINDQLGLPWGETWRTAPKGLFTSETNTS